MEEFHSIAPSIAWKREGEGGGVSGGGNAADDLKSYFSLLKKIKTSTWNHI